MFRNLVSVLFLGLLVPVNAFSNFRELYQFPNTTFHDIENIAIRPNGQLLLTAISEPVLYILDPAASNPTATVLHQFDNANGLAGITQITSDVFALVVGNYSISEYKGIPGTFAIWTINLTSGTPVLKKITSIPSAQTLNGMTTVSSSLVLVADSAAGAVYSVNINTGAYQITIQNAQFQPSAYFPLGINGIHTRGSTLYYTNSAQFTYGMVPITATGTAAGAISIIANAPAGSAYDDFAFDMAGNALITAHPNSIVEAGPAFQFTVANSTQIVQPTAAVFGNTPLTICTLYVVTAGQVTGAQIVSGQVFEVAVC